jgi:hypothetical protein
MMDGSASIKHVSWQPAAGLWTIIVTRPIRTRHSSALSHVTCMDVGLTRKCIVCVCIVSSWICTWIWSVLNCSILIYFLFLMMLYWSRDWIKTHIIIPFSKSLVDFAWWYKLQIFLGENVQPFGKFGDKCIRYRRVGTKLMVGGDARSATCAFYC